mmetsp:Transcript_30163/g.99792  ORF Transcript_30163/g.99792 Transcript_30163/m.99792 type:complete len:489 (+) Transcript_30163:261-1727(+)
MIAKSSDHLGHPSFEVHRLSVVFQVVHDLAEGPRIGQRAVVEAAHIHALPLATPRREGGASHSEQRDASHDQRTGGHPFASSSSVVPLMIMLLDFLDKRWCPRAHNLALIDAWRRCNSVALHGLGSIHLLALRGTDGSEPEVGELGVSARLCLPQPIRGAPSLVARASEGARRGLGQLVGLPGIEPLHMVAEVIPECEGQYHATVEGLAHGPQSTLGGELVVVALGVGPCLDEGIFLGGADRVRYRVALNANRRGLRILNDIAILDVEPSDLGQLASIGTVLGQELRHDGDGPVRVDGSVGPEERLVSHAEGIELATVLVAKALVILVPVAITAIRACAPSRPNAAARMSCHGCSHAIGLKYVHFCATRTSGARLHVGLAIDEVDFIRAARVAVAQAVFGTSSVVTFAQATICLHLHKTQCSVHAAVQRGDVHVKSHLAILQMEHLVVFSGAVHQIQSRADIGLVSNIIDPHTIGDADHAILRRIVST